MAPLFLYGTLRHLPLLDWVVGRRPGVQPARLADHAVRVAGGAKYPLIQREAGAVAEGLLCPDLTEDEIARIDFYEAGFGYRLQEVTVDTQTGPQPARVYMPPAEGPAPGAPWSLDDWAAQDGALSVAAAPEAMGLFGAVPPAVLAQRFPMIRHRAWCRMLADRDRPLTLPPPPAAARIDLRARRHGHAGFFTMDVVHLRAPRFDGSLGPEIEREVFVGVDAALVLPYDPVTDQVVVVEQLRLGAHLRGDPRPWTLEPVAGLVDAGERPDAAAHRETAEETGLTLHRLIPMPGGYASPGYSTDHFHCFLGLADIPAGAAWTGGKPDENEDIRAHRLPLDRALAMADSGEITVVPLITMLYWLARQRETLRASA